MKGLEKQENLRQETSNELIRVLLVEDDPGDARLVRMALSSSDYPSYRIEVFEQLSTAIEQLSERSFDIALVDLSLPDSKGLDIISKISAKDSKIPIVVLTGLNDEEVGLRALQKGAEDYLIKGPDINNLLTRSIRYSIERKKTKDALRDYSQRLEEMVEERTKELADAQEHLVRREKLAVLGQLSGGLGHELRNPLGAIKNAAYFLNMAMKDPEPEVKEALEIMDNEIRASNRIIISLLDFTRPKPANRLKVDLNEIVLDGLSRFRMPENVKVVNQLNETPLIILADPDQLSQVFRNIIHNAIQAMPEGGRLLIKSEALSPKWVTASFTDTGTGINEETQKKVFEPLFTTKARGIGLGLSLTKMLIEAHEGTIEVQSELGKGSTFTVKLPMKD